ncbi:MAG: valine--tRNA ligase, partial [Candidatus Thermoplasmatota archaeon]|nr:valine--tRNA ligase [Candidatus Thermoplasmatota archaeon]
IDFVARYKRMRGYNVMFPLCFDVNGMPIEVSVEKKYDIQMRDTERQEFIKLCEDFAHGNIAEMIRQFKIFGESMDPSVYFQTDAKYYRRLTQISFIKMFHENRIFKANHPVNWCPRCGTALAESEVEYQDNITSLNTILFTMADDPDRTVEIATTRPELLCTCQLVAVHPDDERYQDLAGKELITPIFGRAVPVVFDEVVDRDFGSGVVMICTIGDKEDLRWVFKYGLDLEKGIDERGRMTSLAGNYEGLPLKEAREQIISDMKDYGLLVKQEDNPQNVGTCWRCHTAIEYLQVPQWFIKILDMKEEVLRVADEIDWWPEFMKVRLREWVNSLSWDWVISRQRYFATPIPVWECVDCNHPVLPREEDCYVDPTLDDPPVERCPKCGGELKGSEEVFDTWMDSSITPLYNSFWQRDDELFKKLYPMSLRPQSHDIIRTWAFYSIVRGLKLTGKKPWDTIMMGGFILSPDGTPMHASKGNAVDPIEFHSKYGADPIRYYAATCTLGKDHPFREKDVKRGAQLIRKLYNMERLFSQGLGDLLPEELHAIKEKVRKDSSQLSPADRWILHRFSEVVVEATRSADTYQFDKAVKAVVDFMWFEVADQYVEMVKHRIRDGGVGTLYTIYHLGLGIPKLLAPFLPHIAEEIYQSQFRRFEGDVSIHISPWPKSVLKDKKGRDRGLLAAEIIRSIRRWKSENKISLGAEIGPLRLITKDPEMLEGSLEDIKGTLKAQDVTLERSQDLARKVLGLKPVFREMGPRYRERMGSIISSLKDPATALDLALLMDRDGTIEFDPEDGKGLVTLTSNMVEVQKGWVFQGRSVDHLSIGDVVVLLEDRS